VKPAKAKTKVRPRARVRVKDRTSEKNVASLRKALDVATLILQPLLRAKFDQLCARLNKLSTEASDIGAELQKLRTG